MIFVDVDVDLEEEESGFVPKSDRIGSRKAVGWSLRLLPPVKLNKFLENVTFVNTGTRTTKFLARFVVAS